MGASVYPVFGDVACQTVAELRTPGNCREALLVHHTGVAALMLCDITTQISTP